MMSLHKSSARFAAIAALIGSLASVGLAQAIAQATRPPAQTQTEEFSDAGKAALSLQLTNAISRGDTPGVVALVVGHD
jgi:hypothetical protein